MKTTAVIVAAAMLISGSALSGDGAVPARTRVTSLKVTVLSTMLAGDPGLKGIGEWGYAALVEVDGRKLLFDSGARPETVLRNAEELGIDLSLVTDVVLSHNHADHTNGLLVLRRELSKKNPRALSTVHVAEGIFWSRPNAGAESNLVRRIRESYEAAGGRFIEYSKPVELLPGVWFTGPVPRVYPERNWSNLGRVQTSNGLVEDIVPEDASLVVDTMDGLVVITGCGHAGIINTIEYARKVVRAAPLHAAIGGFHLLAATDETLAWTAAKLKEFGVAHLLAGHCAGIEATYRLRELAGLNRKTAVVSSVGSSFTLGRGIDPLLLAR